MCMMSAPPPPEPVAERSQTRLPDGETARSTAGRRTEDRIRAGTQTILTGSGMQPAQTAGKTLLGA